MGDMRVIYIADPHRRAVPAPELMVRFVCPKCAGSAVLDAFNGVPICPEDRVPLEGIAIIRPPGSAIRDDEKRRRAQRDAGQSR